MSACLTILPRIARYAAVVKWLATLTVYSVFIYLLEESNFLEDCFGTAETMLREPPSPGPMPLVCVYVCMRVCVRVEVCAELHTHTLFMHWHTCAMFDAVGIM